MRGDAVHRCASFLPQAARGSYLRAGPAPPGTAPDGHSLPGTSGIRPQGRDRVGSARRWREPMMVQREGIRESRSFSALYFKDAPRHGHRCRRFGPMILTTWRPHAHRHLERQFRRAALATALKPGSKAAQPDVACLQEIKCVDEKFSRPNRFEDRLGYNLADPRPEDLQRRGAALEDASGGRPPRPARPGEDDAVALRGSRRPGGRPRPARVASI